MNDTTTEPTSRRATERIVAPMSLCVDGTTAPVAALGHPAAYGTDLVFGVATADSPAWSPPV